MPVDVRRGDALAAVAPSISTSQHRHHAVPLRSGTATGYDVYIGPGYAGAQCFTYRTRTQGAFHQHPEPRTRRRGGPGLA